MYFYDDDGGVRVPTSYDLQCLPSNVTNMTGTWTTIADQQIDGILSNNARIRITFPSDHHFPDSNCCAESREWDGVGFVRGTGVDTTDLHDQHCW